MSNYTGKGTIARRRCRGTSMVQVEAHRAHVPRSPKAERGEEEARANESPRTPPRTWRGKFHWIEKSTRGRLLEVFGSICAVGAGGFLGMHLEQRFSVVVPQPLDTRLVTPSRRPPSPPPPPVLSPSYKVYLFKLTVHSFSFFYLPFTYFQTMGCVQSSPVDDEAKARTSTFTLFSSALYTSRPNSFCGSFLPR